MHTSRSPDHPIDARFVARWSPRAFDARPMTAEQLAPLFEAARWAPSCLNSQPWRFVYALRTSAAWPDFLGLLTPNNQAWAQHASALIVLCSYKLMTFPGGTGSMPSPNHSFDTGAAWMQFALQAMELGMRTHAMAGFDRARAAQLLQLPDDCQVEAAIAVGWPGDAAALPEALQAREFPSGRQPLASFAFAGTFPPNG